MKTVHALVICLSLIIAGVLFNTGSAYAADGSRGGDTSCTTQQSVHGNPIIRCAVLGSDKTENGAAPTKHWHRHHHFYRHRFYRSWHRHHFRHYSRHFHHTYHHHHH
jgi:hypothetical protein